MKDIVTDRLTLKCIDYSDREFIYKQFSDEDVNKYLFDAEPLMRIEEADELISFYVDKVPRLQHRWIIINSADSTKMGTCGYHCRNMAKSELDIGYDLRKEYWGKGYMHEALKGMLRYIKDELKVKIVNAYTYEHNESSLKLLERLGFVVTGYTDEIFRGESYRHKAYTLVF